MFYEVVCEDCRRGCGHHHLTEASARHCPGAHQDVAAGHHLVVADRTTGRVVGPVAPAAPLDNPDGQSLFRADVSDLARENGNFRRVVHTGARTQIVVMALPPGGSIGPETHAEVEQVFVIVVGRGEARIGDRRIALHPGHVLVVPPGTRHDVLNVGRTPLRLWTIYSPPNHLPARLHVTRQASTADVEDELFGEQVRVCP